MRDGRLAEIESADGGFRVVLARPHQVLGGMTLHHVLWKDVRAVLFRRTAGRAHLEFHTAAKEVVSVNDGIPGFPQLVLRMQAALPGIERACHDTAAQTPLSPNPTTILTRN